jgi:DNA-binding phage protein
LFGGDKSTQEKYIKKAKKYFWISRKVIMSRPIKKTTDYNEHLIESLLNPEDALAYLQAAMEEYEEDEDMEAFLIALRNLVEAKGGVGKLAEATGLNRQNIYCILSDSGNPRLGSLHSILVSVQASTALLA